AHQAGGAACAALPKETPQGLPRAGLGLFARRRSPGELLCANRGDLLPLGRVLKGPPKAVQNRFAARIQRIFM
ncbi:unnamed protein product, partial [Symbiodinium microadriaticum]